MLLLSGEQFEASRDSAPLHKGTTTRARALEPMAALVQDAVHTAGPVPAADESDATPHLENAAPGSQAAELNEHAVSSILARAAEHVVIVDDGGVSGGSSQAVQSGDALILETCALDGMRPEVHEALDAMADSISCSTSSSLDSQWSNSVEHLLQESLNSFLNEGPVLHPLEHQYGGMARASMVADTLATVSSPTTGAKAESGLPGSPRWLGATMPSRVPGSPRAVRGAGLGVGGSPLHASSGLISPHGTPSVTHDFVVDCLSLVCECKGFEYAILWELEAKTGLLTGRTGYCIPGCGQAQNFYHGSMTLRAFPLGLEIPGRVAFSGQAEWCCAVHEEALCRFHRVREAQKFGIQTVVGIPVASGVLEFGSSKRIEQCPHILRYIQSVCKPLLYYLNQKG